MERTIKPGETALVGPSLTMSDPEMDDYDADNPSGAWGKIPGLPPYNAEDQLLPMERRSPCGCLAWSFLVMLMNVGVFLVNFLLLAAIFLVVLLPTIVVAYFGFQCHSRVSGRPSCR